MLPVIYLQRSIVLKIRFLRELDISVDQALLEFDFASPRFALGLLHKRVFGKSHPSYNLLLPWHSSRFAGPRGRDHDKQLYGHNVEIMHCQGLWNRSIFAMTDIYNDLPQHVVDAPSVKIFKQYLIHIVRTRCQQGDVAWPSSFCGRAYG